MPRLRHIWTGVVVSTSDETAARLGGDWRPVEDAAPVKKATPRPRAKRPASSGEE